MSLRSLSFEIFAVASLFCATSMANPVQDKVKEASLIPTFAKGGCNELVKVVFEEGSEMNLGNILAFTSTLPVPTLTLDVENRCKNVTVIFFGVPTNFFDADALLGGAFLHWEVQNIPAECLKSGFHGQTGDQIALYLPPLHPTNDHHYTFFVYCQRDYIDTEKEMHKDGLLERTGFNPLEPANRYHLGEPIGCNFANSGLVGGVGPDLSNVVGGGAV